MTTITSAFIPGREIAHLTECNVPDEWAVWGRTFCPNCMAYDREQRS